jgi:hypothetical protein
VMLLSPRSGSRNPSAASCRLFDRASAQLIGAALFLEGSRIFARATEGMSMQFSCLNCIVGYAADFGGSSLSSNRTL